MSGVVVWIGFVSASQCCRDIRDDIEQEDVQEEFFRYMEENPLAGVYMEDDEVVEYDQVTGKPFLE